MTERQTTLADILDRPRSDRTVEGHVRDSRMAEESSELAAGAGNLASLAAALLARKGEAEPSAVMPSEVFPFAQRVAPPPVEALNSAGPKPQSNRRELLATSTVADVTALTVADETAKPRRMLVQLSAKEYEALGLVAVKKDTTPQHLLRKVIHDFLIEQCDGSCP